MIENTVLILDTHSAEYNRQASYVFNAFSQICIMMIMK